ncbi:MAG: 2,3-bisphosphoglycerate-independent phosphoglycerate mutase [Crenarchaeota archaeon]|nr:2,3-bisphosphoglycerate-independent phosphoglycerate mutase [Thermoproteota archaeon]
MARALFILLDGGADRPVREYYYKTPLEYARKPCIDMLTSEGMCGILYTIGPGVRPGSDTAHLALFGYDPHIYYKGRGPFEAAGLGMDIRPGDVAFRTNLATVDENGIVIDRRAGRYFTEEEIREIERIVAEVCKIVSEKYGVEIYYKHGTEHRGALVLRGDVSPEVTGNDPHKTGLPVPPFKPLRDDEKARRTAEILNTFVKLLSEKLSKASFNEKRRKEGRPVANMMLIRGGGVLPTGIEPIYRRYRIKPAMVAGIALIKGIGRVLGFEVVDVPGYTGSKTDDFNRAFEKALELLSSHDFVFLHVKPTDAAGHDGDFLGKVDIIERVDKALRNIIDRIPTDTYIVVTCDHATPVKFKDHTGDPVPFLISGPDVTIDDVAKFAERYMHKGALGTIRGLDVMNIIGNYMGILEKFGE